MNIELSQSRLKKTARLLKRFFSSSWKQLTFFLALLLLQNISHAQTSVLSPESLDITPKFVVSPDGRNVVMALKPQASNLWGIYKVPVSGGSFIKLTDAPSQHRVSDIEISPNGQHVVYFVASEFAREGDLYSVPMVGGEPQLLTATPLDPGVVDLMMFSPDSQRLVFLYDFNTFPSVSREIFSVPILGGPLTQIGKLHINDSPEGSFKITPNGQHVVYRGITANGSYQISRVPITGGTQLRIGPELVAFGNTGIGFKISSDSQYAIFTVNPSITQIGHLYSAPLSGGNAVQLNPGTLTNERHATDSKISPDGQFVVFRSNQYTGNHQLIRVPITGGPIQVLNSNSTDQVGENFSISPNNELVAFTSDKLVVNQHLLYLVSSEGGLVSRLSPNLNHSTNYFQFSQDSESIVFTSMSFGENQLLSAQSGNKEVIQLGKNASSESIISLSVNITRDGQKAIFSTGNKLYATSLTESRATQINRDLIANVDNNSLVVNGSDDYIVYFDKEATSGNPGHIYSSRIFTKSSEACIACIYLLLDE